ncbi:MAG: DNA gyrase inhibitor YacG [Gammaproteobacteria bacterium]
MQVKCPNCKIAVEWSDSSLFRPFCSERCKLVDLGDWFEERNSISEDQEPPLSIQESAD